jgi:GTP-binding protein
MISYKTMIYKKEIRVVGGHGGDGCASFRREKYVPFGGPDGGDGGGGGNVVVMCDPNLMDLGSLGRRKEFAAGDGHRGERSRRRGRKGKDLDIAVPAGTMVFSRAKSDQRVLLADLISLGQRVLAASGGRGGLGNARFATAVNQAPQIAGKGESGEIRDVILEVKLITDICIVGFPNSGKSSLLSAISKAKPEVADYPFTTRRPVLGVMNGDRRDFIVAEIPGLVKGAHSGKGLGNDFLRHAERTKLLVYLLDGSSASIVDDLGTLCEEIALYGDLSRKARIMAVNKIDLPEVRASLPAMQRGFAEVTVPIFYISVASGEAVLELSRKAADMVEQASREEEIIDRAQLAVFRPKPRK